MNEELYNLYHNVNEKVYKYVTERNKNKNIRGMQSSYPLFLKLSENFIGSKNKIIIYGQETFGWHDTFSENKEYNMLENKIDGILETYQKFYNEKGYLRYYPSPFWNVFRLIENLCCESGKTFGLLFNDITKLGLVGGGFPYNWYDDIIKPYFNELVIREIEIIKPDFLIFLTGRDNILDDIFHDLHLQRENVDGFDQYDLCKLLVPNIKIAYRTQHPQTMYARSKNGSYKNIIFAIYHSICEKME